MIGSPNFSRAEILRASLPATPAQVERYASNIQHTTAILERVRAILGKPIVLESFVRTPEENRSLANASATSDHLSGLAVDVRVPGMPADEIMERLAPHVRALGIDQLIRNGPNVVHIGAGRRARGELLVASAAGGYIPYRMGTVAPIVADATRAAKAPASGAGAGSAQSLGPWPVASVAFVFALAILAVILSRGSYVTVP